MNKEMRTMKEKLTESSDVCLKARIANEIARAYLYRDTDQVTKYGTLALDYALLCDNPDEQGKAYLSLGAACFLRQNYEKGVYYYSCADGISKEDPINRVRMYMGIGVCFSQLNCHKNAIEYEEKALLIATKEAFHPEMAAIYNNIARVYNELGDYHLSKNYYLRGLQIALDDSLYRTQGYIYLGLIQNDLMFSFLDDVEFHLLKIENIIDKHDEMWFMGISQCLKGCYYAASHNFESAKIYFNLGIEIIEAERQDYYLNVAYLNYTKILYTNGEYSEAKNSFERYKQTLDAFDLKIAYPKYYEHMADFYSHFSDIKSYNIYQEKYFEAKNSLEKIIRQYF